MVQESRVIDIFQILTICWERTLIHYIYHRIIRFVHHIRYIDENFISLQKMLWFIFCFFSFKMVLYILENHKILIKIIKDNFKPIKSSFYEPVHCRRMNSVHCTGVKIDILCKNFKNQSTKIFCLSFD